ncbi:hypothetical protein ACQP3R_05525 [Bacillus inaquosorum]|uniref:hypothetical protein n=1 Tax=Bacillus inaquosorum TaxID=483913 RepID=UPI003D007AB6
MNAAIQAVKAANHYDADICLYEDIYKIKTIGGIKIMEKDSKVKQDTIVCRVCEEVIDTAHSSEGVKVLYGICQRCFGSENLKE